jgi:hypothetical protein
MKKYLLFIIPLFIWGCGKNYDNVIDPGTANFQVKNVSSDTAFVFAPGDSVITVWISLNSSANIASVFCNIDDPDNNTLNNSPVLLYDDGNLTLHGDITAGDTTYSNKFPFSQSYMNGKYSVKYYIVDKNNITTLAAVHSFTYNNETADFAPVISNLVAPDTVTLDPTQITPIPLTIKVADANGLNDISIVFFNSYLPNGNPSSTNPFIMYDDGNLAQHGDAVANDGVYSLVVRLPNTGVALGTYRWEFQARDREGKTSSIITHNIVIK